MNFCLKTREIESVCKVLFVDFAKVFIASGRDELVGSQYRSVIRRSKPELALHRVKATSHLCCIHGTIRYCNPNPIMAA